MAEDRGERLRALLSIVEEPERGPRRLPSVLGHLDADDPTLRSGAAWALSAVADHEPDVVPYLVARLLDRRDAAEPSPAVEAGLTFLAVRYPDRVESALDAVEESASADVHPSSVVDRDFSRAGYDSPDGVDRDIGRTRTVGEATSPRRSSVDVGGRARGRDDTDAADTDDERDGERRESRGETGDPDDDAEWLTPAAREEWAATERLGAVLDRSRFEDLTVLARRRSGRYAEEYRTLGALDGAELPVSLALYHRPSADRTAFREALADRLDRWADVGDHDNVLTVYDWDTEPRPWAATEYAGLTLYDRGRLEPGLALWNARRIADALTAAHERGAVHGGLDPGNVAYQGAVLDEREREPPLVTNVGLLEPFRHHFDPTRRLDPRYAAPEYFDRSYGRVDHATDVYHVGAVVYCLFTGEPPYDGTYAEVRDAVREAAPPRPGLKVGVPPGVDDVVTKAMATRKLGRYESVGRLGAELDRIAREWSDD